MKIGVYFGRNIIGGALSGGAFTFTQSILEALKKYTGKHSFVVFSDDCKNQKIGNINVVKLNRYYSDKSEFFLKRIFLKIPRKIKKLKLEKKYFNALNKAVIDQNIELMWFATPAYEFVQIPFIYTVWDIAHRLNPCFPEVSFEGCSFENREKLYNKTIPRATYVVIGNEAGKKSLIESYSISENRIKAIPLPVSDLFLNSQKEKVDIKHKYNISGNYLFYPAQFWPHKNHILILMALKILEEKYNLDFDVVFTGSDKGNLDYIKQKTKELNLENKVHFLNFVPVEDIIVFYKNAFALVFPTFFGPDNIPPLEAFALSCPVIASNIDGAQYQLDDAALLFDPKSEFDLAEKITKLYDDKELKNILVQKGLQRVEQMTSNCYLNKIEKIIDEFGSIRRCWSSEK
ncbi:glycosyltransferase family 4 protein [Candidatus Dependentiae bacterium]